MMKKRTVGKRLSSIVMFFCVTKIDKERRGSKVASWW